MSKTASNNDRFEGSERHGDPLLGKATVNDVWNDKTIWLRGVVTEHLDEIVLELTWLQEQGVVWDFKTGRLTVNGESH